MALEQYLAEEVAEDHADGMITRREALRRLALLGVGAVAGSALLAACAGDDTPRAPASPDANAAGSPGSSPAAVTGQDVTFEGPAGRRLMGVWAEPADATAGVLVVHENRGVTPWVRSVTQRLASEGYGALAVDLVSEEGGTAAIGDEAKVGAALNDAPEQRLIDDLRAGITEIRRRLPAVKVGAVGFCFGGGMVWRLLHAGEDRLSAAAPFYGPAPDSPDFSKAKAAVLGVYAENDARVNASRDATRDALAKAGLVHEVVIVPGADHAFMNDTGARYNQQAADDTWRRLTAWFGTHLAG